MLNQPSCSSSRYLSSCALSKAYFDPHTLLFDVYDDGNIGQLAQMNCKQLKSGESSVVWSYQMRITLTA